MSSLLALVLAFTGPSDAAVRTAQNAAPSESWGLRTIIGLAAGKAPSCELQYEGALKAWSKTITRCPGTDEFTPQLPQMLGAQAKLVIEERFAVGERPKYAMASENPLEILHGVAQLEIDAAGNLSSCKVLGGTGIEPPGLPSICAMIPKQYLPLKDPTGTPAPFTAYFDRAWYVQFDGGVSPDHD